MTRIFRFLFPLVVLAGAFLLPAGQAHAGSYYVQLCGTNAGANQASQSTTYSSGTVGNRVPASGTTCFTNTSNGTAYYLGATKSSGASGGASAYNGFSITMPSGQLSISEIAGSLAACRSSSATTIPRLQIRHSGSTTQTFSSNSGSDGYTNDGASACSNIDYTALGPPARQDGFIWGATGSRWNSKTVGGTTSVTNMGGNADQMRLYIACPAGGCPSGDWAQLVARNLRLRINDSTAPTTPTVTTGPWSDTAVTTNVGAIPVRKTATSGITSIAWSSSTDTGGGLHYSSYYVNGTYGGIAYVCNPSLVSWSQNAGSSLSGSYPVGDLDPCPIVAQSGSNAVSSIDPATTVWKEGLNDVTVKTFDYANDTTTNANPSSASAVKQLVIDNTAPTVNPGGCTGGTAGSNGWYTVAPSLCTAGVNDTNSSAYGGSQYVAGLDNTSGFAYQNTMSGGKYGESSLYNETILLTPQMYWPLDGAITDKGGGIYAKDLTNAVPASAVSDTNHLGPFQNSNTYTFSSGSNLNTTTDLPTFNSFSVAAWIRPTSDTGSPAIISQDGSNTSNPDTDNAFTLRMISGGRWIQFYGTAGGAVWSCLSNGSVPLDQWSHVVATRDSSAGSGKVRIYINGNDTDCLSNTDASGTTVSFSTLRIGSSLSTSFVGKIAHATVFTSVLSNIQSWDLYRAGCQAGSSDSCLFGVNGTTSQTGNVAESSFVPSFEGSSAISVTGKDKLANTASGSGTVKVDTVNPEARLTGCTGTGSGSGGALVNGWYTSNVTCTLIGNDVTSKPNVLAWSKDNGGNYSTISSTTAFPRYNLLPNPRALFDTTGWANVSMTTMSRSATPTVLNGRTKTAIFFQSSTSGANFYSAGAVTSGLIYVCSAYVYRSSGGTAVYVLQARRADGTTVIATSSNGIGQAQSGSWQRLEVAFIAPASENARCTIAQNGSGTAASGFVSEAMLEETISQKALPFFDGSSPTASWSGTALNSTSTINSADVRATVPVSTSSSDEGTFTVKGRVTDGSGRATETAAWPTLKIDRNNPTTNVSCTGTTGTNGWFTSQPTCTLSGQDTANGSGVVDLRRKIDSGSWETVVSPDPSQPD